jgi:hypothetical protein
MSGNLLIGRGGGHIGQASSSHGRDGGDDEEAKKRRSDATRLRGSYRYTKYGLTPPPAFNKWEARANRGRCSPASAPALPLRRGHIQLVLGAGCVVLACVPCEHEGRRPPPPPRPAGSQIDPEVYVADEALPRILELIEESSRREAEKAAKWKREAELQELMLDTVSSSDDI